MLVTLALVQRTHKKVEEAKLLIRELLREEALERVHVAMEEEDFDVLIKAIQVRHTFSRKPTAVNIGQ